MIASTRLAGPVLLFTGHMVDLPERKEARFPPDMEALAAAAIDNEIDAAVGTVATRAVAISSAARGGDLLFLEACRRRNITCRIVIPFPPETFVQRSVAGVPRGDWITRFWRQWDLTAPEEREILQGEHPLGPYVACNLRLIELAKSCDGSLHLIALWNRQKGDGPGGTADLIKRAQAAGGDVHLIDSGQLLRSLVQDDETPGKT